MQNAIVNVNGQIISTHSNQFDPSDWVKVSIFDRAYLYGDSLYEVTRSYNGKLFGVDEHLSRIQRSAELCRMKLGQSLEHYHQEIQRTHQEFLKKFKTKNQVTPPEAYCRIIISRGEGKIGFGLSCVNTSSLYTIIIQPLQEPTEEQVHKGMKVQVVDRLRYHPMALDPALKSGNYLNCLLAYVEAAENGYDDALLCNADLHLTEGTTFNLFYVRRGIIATPPLDVGILHGITRRFVIDLAQKLEMPVREISFPKERIYEADEVFLSSTIREVFPITRIDGHTIGHGKPGPITLKLRKLFREFAIRKLTQEETHS